MMSTELVAVSNALGALWPDCDPSVRELFLQLLEEPAVEIVKRARFVLGKPYGTNSILLDSGMYGLSFAQLGAGQSTSLHFHNTRREFFCVHHGTLALTSNGETTALTRHQCAWSTPGRPHRLANTSDGPLGVLEIFSPALLNDKVRLQDKYQRTLGLVTLHQ